MRAQHQCLLTMAFGLTEGGSLAADGAINDTVANSDSSAPNTAATADTGSLEEVLVTARRRQELLQDVAFMGFYASAHVVMHAAVIAAMPSWVLMSACSSAGGMARQQADPSAAVRTVGATRTVGPIAVTVPSAEMLLDNQINIIKDIAAYSRGLNVNWAARSCPSTASGTTLMNAVQPGVGIFIDGIYEPDTSYLNRPIVDVECIEALRGPQGTLFGNKPLGDAIILIQRQPSDTFAGFAGGSHAGNENNIWPH